MKKIIYLVLSLLLISTVFTACSDGSSSSDDDKKPQVTITFDSNGGSAVDAVKIDKNSTLPADYFGTGSKVPTFAGNTFTGWKNGTAPVTPETTFPENATLTAQWEAVVVPPQTVTVTFSLGEYEEGTPPKPVTIGNGTALGSQFPSDPTWPWTWEGAFTFLGWFNGADKTPYTKDTVITANITLTADWQDNRIFTLPPAIHPGSDFNQEYPTGLQAIKSVEFTIEKLFSNLPSPEDGILSAQWYRTTTEEKAKAYDGVKVGEQNASDSNPSVLTLSYTGVEDTAGEYWYWVEVTNTYAQATESKTATTRTQYQLKVTVTE